jgi:Tfp pilus assembly PilM family ATPase
MHYLNTFYQKLRSLSKLHRYIGLAINTSYITLVELQHINNNYELLTYAFETITSEEDAQKTISKILKHTTAKNIVISIPYAKIQNKTININKTILKTTSIENFLRLNHNNLPQKYFDYYVSPTNQEYTDITSIRVISSPQEIIHKYTKFFSSINHPLTTIDINIYALWRATSFIYPHLAEPYTIVNIDQEKLLLGHINNQQLQSAQEINIQITDQKNSENIAQYILQQIALLAITNNTLLMCGTTASSELTHALTDKISVPVILANPLQKFSIASHLHSKITHLQIIAPALMLSYGLALHKGNCYERT